MANFFQPGDAKQSTTQTGELSPAQQAMMKFRAQLLGQLLDAKAGNKPTFKSFVGGGPVTTPMPGGMGAGMADVLAAMGKPGAFSTSTTSNTSGHGPTPSGMNDLSQMVGLGVLGLQLFNMLKGKFGDTGAVQGATTPGGFGNEPTNQGQSLTSGNAALDALIMSQYGGGGSMIPGGDMTQVPADYPGLNDGSGTSWLSALFGG